jgi:two-component system cell cycle sensor histidine kinase/response regulator CckA
MTLMTQGKPALTGTWSAGGLSIRVKLFLVIGALLLSVTLIVSGTAYSAMKTAAIDATSTRLDGIALQWARMLEGSTGRGLTALRAARDSRAIRDALSKPGPRTLAVADSALRRLLPASAAGAAQILGAASGRITAVGDSAALSAATLAAESVEGASSVDSGAVGKLRSAGGMIFTTVAVRIVEDGKVLGYLLLTSRLRLTPSPEAVNRLFGGEGTQIRLANLDGSLWTDIEKPIPSPDVDLRTAQQPVAYATVESGPVFAAIRPIATVPFAVVLEAPQRVVLAQATAFRTRILWQLLVVIVTGMAVALVMSGSLTKPLARLTDSAEAVAAGDYSRYTGLAARGDELGRVARSFDSMITQLQSAFASRRAAEDSHRILFNSVPLPVWVVDLDSLRIVSVNDQAIQHYGYSREEFLTLTVAELRPDEDVPRMRDAIRRIDGSPDRGSEWRHKKKDGSIIVVETHAHSINFQGKPARIIVVHDITERKQAKDEIRRLDERYRRLVENSPDGITLTTVGGRFIAVNPAAVAMLGYESEAEVLALDARATYASPEDRTPYIAKLAEAGTVQRHEVRLKRKDGTAITVLITARVVTDSDTADQYVESVIQDVTELRRVERQFQQAQKMEAVGQLAGGVAHDFNNLLTVILSYSDFLLSELPEDAVEHRENVEAIREAGVSASGLTRQLLVFSRQQVIEPRVMRLNELITGTSKMLTRLIGEHVELATQLDASTGAIRVDPGLMEQVIVNLAVNARDAMPNGGRLLIESKNVDFWESVAADGLLLSPGPYVTLAVSDNGVGMDVATQAHAFEPFFTTKAVGKGSGLGLATVYGIVRQSGGQISLYSEPGRGTTFKLYFPRVDEARITSEFMVVPRPAPRGTETILLVEDNPTVRVIAREVLQRQGYHVLEALDSEGALEITEKHEGEIALLLTDVIMPQMSGRELADRFARLRPEARVLFVSGYTDDAIVHHGVLEREMHFLQKPFTGDALLRKVREVLGEVPRPAV